MGNGWRKVRDGPIITPNEMATTVVKVRGLNLSIPASTDLDDYELSVRSEVCQAATVVGRDAHVRSLTLTGPPPR